MAAKGDDFEYVTQLFGFTPKAFVDGIYNAINDYIKDFFKEMGKVLDEEFGKGDAILSFKIRERCKSLIAKCYRSVDKSIDKMETYLLKNIFVLSPVVLLPEDETHREVQRELNDENSLTEPDLDKEILELKTGILKELCYREMLQREQRKLRKVLEEVKRLDEWFDKVCREVNKNNLQQAVDLVSSSSVEILDLFKSRKQIKN